MREVALVNSVSGPQNCDISFGRQRCRWPRGKWKTLPNFLPYLQMCALYLVVFLLLTAAVILISTRSGHPCHKPLGFLVMQCSSSNSEINASVLLLAKDFLTGSETICTLLELLRKQLITVKCQTSVNMYQPAHCPLSLTTISEYILFWFLLVILIFFPVENYIQQRDILWYRAQTDSNWQFTYACV